MHTAASYTYMPEEIIRKVDLRNDSIYSSISQDKILGNTSLKRKAKFALQNRLVGSRVGGVHFKMETHSKLIFYEISVIPVTILADWFFKN